MLKTDDGFQGFRPLIHEPTWDAMTSKERRRAFWTDIAVCLGTILGIYLYLFR